MRRALRALWDGAIVRCPRCRQGRMFESAFGMRGQCPVCGLPFERSSGEISGGMGINAFVTQTIVFVLGAALGWFTKLPLGPLLLLLVVLTVVLPIALYRPSRGVWAAILFLTGDNEEED